MSTSTPSTDQSSQHPPSPRRRRHWRTWLIAVAVLLALLAGLTLVALQTEWSARLLWQGSTRLLRGQLSGDFVGGSLATGLHMRDVGYRSDSMHIKIDRLDTDWRFSLKPLSWHIRSLRIGRADVTLLPTPSEPASLPSSLTLPLRFVLDNASVQQLTLHQGGNSTQYRAIALQARTDGVQHSVTLEQVLSPFGKASASLRLHGEAPFATTAKATLDSTLAERRYRIDGDVSGTLQALGIQIRASGDKLSGQAAIDATPFAAVPFQRAQIDLRHVDPQVFNPDWPRADLTLSAALQPVAEQPAASTTAEAPLLVTGPVTLTNAAAGAIDQGLLPLVSVSTRVTLDTEMQQLAQIRIKLAGGAQLQGSGALRSNGQGQLALQAQRLDLHALHTALKPTQLNGPLDIDLDGATQKIGLKLASKSLAVTAKATLTPQLITLHTAQLQSGPAQLALDGTLGRDGDAAYAFNGKLKDFNPALFFSPLPRAGGTSTQPLKARINTDFDVQGKLRPLLSAKLQFKVRDSIYDGLPMTGAGTIALLDQRLLPSDAQLSIAGNKLQLTGSFGNPGDRLRVDINAPALQRLGFGLSGLLRVNGTIAGSLKRPLVDASYQAEKLVLGSHRLERLSGAAQIQGVPGSTPNAQVKLDLKARGLRSGDIQFQQLNAAIDGTYAKHRIQLDANGRFNGETLDLTLAAEGRLRELAEGMAWDGSLRTLENRGLPQLSMATPLQLSVAPGKITLGATRISIEQAAIDLKSLQYDSGNLRTEGSAKSLDIKRMLALWEKFGGESLPFKTDLVIDGSWNLTLAERAAGYIEFARRRGDIRVIGDNALGLNTLMLRADLRDNRIDFDSQMQASRIGSVNGSGQIALQRVDGRYSVTPQAAISGRVSAAIPQLQTISALAGPRISLEGSVAIDVQLTGTLGNPVYSGMVNGKNLALTLYDQGVRLRDGTARIKLNNDIAEIQQLEFYGGDGTLRASGRIPLDQSISGISATIVADKLQLVSNPSGQLTLSGQANAANDAGQLLVTGKFTVDKARFSLPETPAPKLSDDVIVIRGDKPPPATVKSDAGRDVKPASPYSPRVNVALNLGNDFRFEGAGAALQLGGTLNLKSEPGQAPQAYGTVQVLKGTYEAFGTELAIERGIINFQGTLDNPNVNILAMRRNQEVPAGVQVTGNVQRPRVTLVSEPDLPQEEKLSWLVFGRSGGGSEAGQAQAAVSGAALGLLNKFGSGRIAKTFGLDTLAVGQSEFGLQSGQVVNLGKTISDRFYIGYEQSLVGAESVLKLTYTLTRYWSVVARGGTVTGLEILYNKRFDTLW